MPYIDGFVVPVKKARLDDYRKMAERAAKVWREHGALSYHESVADDVKPGKVTSFPQSVMLEEDETVVFAWIVYESRAKRDEVNAKVMADPRLADMEAACEGVTDAKRMFWGGFQTLVEA